MSESLTGVTFLAFGNGSPDVFSTFAAMKTHSGSLAVGELFGAAGFITAVVAASMALVSPFQVARKSFVRDVGFFIVAASFSMVFLVDGKLQVWECAVMVAFYVFYVIFVVGWHWYLGRRRRIAESKARLHHHIPQTQELDLPDHHDDDEETPAHERTNLLGEDGGQDISALEGATTPTWELEDIDDDDEARDRYLADLRSGMRISRARRGERRSTMTPIRPSLIGALEFRAVLNMLHKRSTTSLTSPIGLRGYSDDRSVSFSQASDNQSVRSHPELSSHHVRSSEGNAPARSALDTTGRMRAVSADNAVGLRLNTNVLTHLHGVPETAIYSASPLPTGSDSSHLQVSEAGTLSAPPQSPQLLISPPVNTEPAPQGLADSRSPQYLAPPGGYFHRPDYQEEGHHETHSPGNTSPTTRPLLEVPKLVLPHSDSEQNYSTSPFPMYTDSPAVLTPGVFTPNGSRRSSILLPEPIMSPDSAPEAYLGQRGYEDEEEEAHRSKWWPYSYLPDPWIILSTLFPTIYGWHDKSVWDKMLGTVSVPSVLLLAATLPVVECEEDEKASIPSPGPLDPGSKTRSRAGTQVHLNLDSPHINVILPPRQTPSHPHKSFTRQNSEPLSIIMAQRDELPSSPKDWNRWLVFLQIFTAPLFVAMIVWANIDDDHDTKSLLILILSSLLFSLICLLLIIATTTPDHPPKYRPLFCFLGFIVAIAWISTIANEVVGVLKAFGVILGMSDAILGLTIFAVGNSLGDLVADVTVAKLGYPVMALSACFGGPMLNILLGIGLSGLYVTLRHGTKYHAKHPHLPMKYKPFELEVSTTLMISGVTLLITLVGLLIVVPLNGWRMDRKVGWGLIVLWSLSTIGNVIIEILGYGGDLAGLLSR
jgi:sodium/potassium/calcium exchanger 6